MIGARTPELRLVGRDSVLAALAEERDASTVAGRTVVVAGEAGIGKTALMRAFTQDSLRAGSVVVEGACVEIEKRRPFAAFVDLLADCTHVFGEPRIRDLIAKHALYLKPLLGDAAGAPSASMAAPEDRFRVQSSVLGLIEALSKDRPVTVAVEDLHWVDEASLELFAYLAKRIRRMPVLLIATYRSDELDRRHILRPVLTQLAGSRLTSEVTLGPLDVSATLELVRHAAGERVAATRDLFDVAELVHQRCAGNPLFIEETIHALRQRRALGESADSTGAGPRLEQIIPRSINDATLARAAALSHEAQRVLGAAAIAGESIEPSLVASITALSESHVVALLVEAFDLGLLVDAEGETRFRHALVREAIRRSLLSWERKQLHRRVAEELERHGATPFELAYHYDEAGAADKAIDHYEKSAARASADTPAAAARAVERALELTSDGDSRRPVLLTRLADFLLHDGRNAEAQRAATTAIELAGRAGDIATRSQAMLALARTHRERENRHEYGSVLRALVELIEPLGPSTNLVSAYTELGIFAMQTDPSESLRLTRKAIELAEAIGSRGALAHALQMHGVALFIQGRSVEAIPVLERALPLAQAEGRPRMTRSVLENLNVARSNAGDPPEAERTRRQEVQTFDRQHRLRAARILIQELDWLFADGAWDTLLSRTVEVDERDVNLSARASSYVAVITIAREGLDAAAEQLRSAHRDLVACDLRDFSALRIGLAWILAARPAEALAIAHGAAASPPSSGILEPDHRGLAALVGMIAARTAGDAASFRSLSALAVEPRQQVKRQLHAACVAFANAEIARQAGQLDTASSAYREAARMNRCRVDHPRSWFESLAYLYQAEVLLEQHGGGAREQAQASFDACLPYWRDAKATYFLSLLHERAGRLGLSFPAEALPRRPQQAKPDPLTKRQREIATLVADGLTNREIAERMTLSVRTAESHVEQIRAKLGFHTRAQIAAWVTERYGPQRAN